MGAVASRAGKSLLPKTEEQELAGRGEQTQGPGAGQKRAPQCAGQEKVCSPKRSHKASEEGGANPGPGSPNRAGKSLLPKTEKQGLARKGEQNQGPGAGQKWAPHCAGQEKVYSPERKNKG